ncbi:amino acid ABC transporter substrate-binding protein [Alkalihalobacillus alcalophilus ATCC 27647 = CGMCC 1.3604]|uniref:Amino acid ABC transporter substrate-binding protein n=1 Tax=Alkalihalobacillus alcalophilus ATCC 27647 = CGMCC 1.3604 TaxID=1218173 RepID=A0A094WFR0_ALKAL|nr:ectoine/hydroxyectoine ABC transporter substrate-binding protein EhuB [Alkalihalobacillus alcalophilus]KGA95606.1 amino acid ABC transporter substrate-binding protein [Alkalihalobacillus alcalophilus ATCC 27647 = CGMCC 1.3604]MED1563681.1 ectoine/hydroxyectoine ABC transporter substrate-binding protein EhuB [Alkalihalobacillus alcalophilus]THG90035.1 amino acid ABC transporter substrate-binding protein [Alkalihalobacillus alcalophilus ATCC 27647 = CGMCC 1.3604]
MKKMTVGILLAGMLVLLAACGSSETGGSGDKIKVGVANEEPYGYIDLATDNVTGANAEIARAVFQSMGYEDVEGEITDWNSLLPGLNAGNYDVVTAGMDIRPERCEQAEFANVELVYGEGMAVAAGNPHNLHSYEDLAAAEDLTVSIMAAANQIEMLKQLGMDESRIITADSIADNIAALESGDVDATVMTEATLTAALESANLDAIERAEPFTQPVIDGEPAVAYGAAVFADTDEGRELRDEYNEHLQQLIDSGELLEIISEFGFGEENVPTGDVTTDDRCNA